MILTLDVGNTQIYGGVFHRDDLILQFRRGTTRGTSSDELGIFLRTVLSENKIDAKEVKEIAFCSVVPDLVHALGAACTKYFAVRPFILQAGVRTGLKIKYRNPLEVGADRIANAVAAMHLYPNKNIIIVDFGTATTFCVVNAAKEYLGGLILPGFRISMETLSTNTAKLPVVEIVAPEEILGRSTVESIQSGLYFGNLYALTGISERIKHDYFKNGHAVLIGTGGFSRLLQREKAFDIVIPDLVHTGLRLALQLNKGKEMEYATNDA